MKNKIRFESIGNVKTSVIVALDVKIYQRGVTVDVRRRWTGETFEWKVYLNPTQETLRRLARILRNRSYGSDLMEFQAVPGVPDIPGVPDGSR